MFHVMSKWTTLTEFILKEEQKIPQATGSLTLLLNQIAEGTKIIASHVAKSGLIDIEGSTGTNNIYQEDVQKLDKFSNNLLIDILSNSGQVSHIASEELPKIIEVKGSKGRYMVFMDPLDGSSNIDTNAPIGTIFSIYAKSGKLLQPGAHQVAAGYVLYGSSVIFVYTALDTVNGFTLDPSVGSFLLSHPLIKIPEEKREYSINEGNAKLFDKNLTAYLESIKTGDKPYQLRYIGTLVADMHRTLLKGGLFFNPANSQKPHGKLRLMFEVNPFALLVERAFGMASSNGKNPVEILPSSLTERVPIVMGSKREVEKYLSFERE